MKKKTAFTLIELLVVVVIIAMLSAVALVSTNSARITSRDAKRKADVKGIATALEAYAVQKGSFGKEAVYSSISSPNWECAAGVAWSSWSDLQQKLAAFVQLSTDPVNQNTPNINCGNLAYAAYSVGTLDEVWAFLENRSDPDRHEIRRYQTDVQADCSGSNKGVKFSGSDTNNFNAGKYKQIYWYTNSPIECQ